MGGYTREDAELPTRTRNGRGHVRNRLTRGKTHGGRLRDGFSALVDDGESSVVWFRHDDVDERTRHGGGDAERENRWNARGAFDLFTAS